MKLLYLMDEDEFRMILVLYLNRLALLLHKGNVYEYDRRSILSMQGVFQFHLIENHRIHRRWLSDTAAFGDLKEMAQELFKAKIDAEGFESNSLIEELEKFVMEHTGAKVAFFDRVCSGCSRWQEGDTMPGLSNFACLYKVRGDEDYKVSPFFPNISDAAEDYLIKVSQYGYLNVKLIGEIHIPTTTKITMPRKIEMEIPVLFQEKDAEKE